MLRDRYESDAWFWAIIAQLAIEMDPELAQIDSILDDDELFKMIKNARRECDEPIEYPLA